MVSVGSISGNKSIKNYFKPFLALCKDASHDLEREHSPKHSMEGPKSVAASAIHRSLPGQKMERDCRSPE
jgi:hypothetical protein